MSRSRPDKAREALQQFRGSTCNINQEMETLINFSNKNNIKRLTGFREIVNALLKPNAVKPFTLLFLYFFNIPEPI